MTNRTKDNPNCDGSGPHDDGVSRVLPLGGGSNLILCFPCYRAEIYYRRDRNRTLGDFAKFDLPMWADLKIYAPAG